MVRVVIAVIVTAGILLAIFVVLDLYLRWSRRRELESQHAQGDGASLTREDYVAKGMAEYRRSPERRLLWGVFLVPLIVVGILALLAK
ncbi:MAG: hypothetical protein AAF713_14280 [Pseudomonadota bacterium]